MSQDQRFSVIAENSSQHTVEQPSPQLVAFQLNPSPPTSPLQRHNGAPSSPHLKPSASPPYHPKQAPSFMHSAPPPAPVNIREGTWTRGEVIGDGAFGTVYKALDNSSGSLFAVKQVPLQAFDKRNSNAALQNLVTEIELLQELVHTNIVRYFGCEISSDTMSIFLEYAPGGSITGMLKRFGAFPEDTIRVYTLHILLGLNFLHSANIVHRDIKGSNVLVDTDGCCKLADFGCSKSLSDIADASPSFKGTMRFMAPEVINGIDHGKPADVWALGCTIIEMLTARHPWAQFELPESAMYHVGSLKATPPIPTHASPEIHNFLQSCFSSEPSERWTVPQLLGHPFISPVIDAKRDFVPFFLDNDGSIGSSASYASSSRNHKAGHSGLVRSNSQASVSATHHTETSVSSQQTFWPAFLEEAPMITGRDEELRLLLQGLASQPGDVKVAFIWGAGGTGKSALANRLCSLLHRAPVFIEKYQRHQREFAKQMMTSWGWEELVDDRGVKYYGNPQLKITQYEHPSLGIFGGQAAHNRAGSNVSRIELPKHPALALPYGWEMLKDASGYIYYGNPQLRITQYQHPSLGIISQNKTLHESSQIFSAQTFNHSGTSSFSSIANAGRQSRETPLLDDPNDCIHTQDDFTDASDDDVSDDDMEEFFTEENLGYAMKILEDRHSVAPSSSKDGNPFVQIDLQASSSHPVSVNDAMDFVIRGAYTVLQQSMLPIEKELHLKRMYYASYGTRHKFVVFDDVGTAAHIRQLLPRSRATIIITSRRNVGLEFEGIRCVSLNLQPLEQSKSIHLLRAIVPRLDDKSAAELALLCGHLPLALKAIGSTLARRQHMDASEMCDILRKNPARRLALVENCVRQSFLCLDEQHRIFLVALHVFPGSFTSRAASAVIKSRLSLTEDALHELTEHSMLHYDKSARRYRLQDLVRVFCEQEALSMPSAQKEKWIRRLLNFFLKSVAEAEEQYTTLGHAGGSYQNNPLRVLNLEKPNLEEVIRLAYERKHSDLLVEMSRRARQVLRVVLSSSVRVLLYRVCVVQLRQKNDKEGELVSLCELGHALGVMLLFAEAKICLRTSFSISKALHSVPLQCWVSSTLAWVLFSEARHTLRVNEGSLDSLALSIHNHTCNEAEKLYSNVLAALEDFFLFHSDDIPEKSSPGLPLASPKSAPMSPAVAPLESRDFSIFAPVAGSAAAGSCSDESSSARVRRPSSLLVHELGDAAVQDSTGSLSEKEKKGRWQGLLSSSKVPSSFSRRPSITDDSVLRVQTEKVMMKRLQSSVTYKLALLESHMHRYEDAKYHYESALRMYSDNPRHPRVAAIMLGLGCLYMNTGDHLKSIGVLQRALDIREEALGTAHPAVADILVNLIAAMRLAAEKMPLAQGWEQKEDAEGKSYWYNPGKLSVQYYRPLPDSFCDGSGGPTLKDLETRLCSLESQSSMSANLSGNDVLLGLQELFVQSAQPEGAFGRFLSLLRDRNKGSGGAVAEALAPIPSISSSRLRSGSSASEWMCHIASTLTSSLNSKGPRPLSPQKQESSDSDGEIEDSRSGQQQDLKVSKISPANSRQDACVMM